MSEIHDLNIKDKITDDYATVDSGGGLATVLKDGVNGDLAKITSEGAQVVSEFHESTRPLDLNFLTPLSVPSANLATALAIGDTTIELIADPTPNVAVGDTIVVTNPNGQYFIAEITLIGASPIFTLDRPCDEAIPTAGTNIIIASTHMNVSGSLGTPVAFQVSGVGAGVAISLDITRIMGNISDDGAMDDGMFGGLTILTNGVVFRKRNLSTGAITNYWNVKSNGDIGLLCFDAQYTTKAPAGENGYRFRNTYAGISKHGTVIRLLAQEILEVLIQDDLTGLTDFQMQGQGHIVTDTF